MRRGADAAPAQSESMVPVGRAAHRRPYDGITGDEGIVPMGVDFMGAMRASPVCS